MSDEKCGENSIVDAARAFGRRRLLAVGQPGSGTSFLLQVVADAGMAPHHKLVDRSGVDGLESIYAETIRNYAHWIEDPDRRWGLKEKYMHNQTFILVIHPIGGQLRNADVEMYRQLRTLCQPSPDTIILVVNRDQSARLDPFDRDAYRAEFSAVIKEHKMDVAGVVFMPNVRKLNTVGKCDESRRARDHLRWLIGKIHERHDFTPTYLEVGLHVSAFYKRSPQKPTQKTEKQIAE